MPTSSERSTIVSGRIVLNRHEEKRLLGGHAWVFSNEIDRVEGGPVPGGIVEVARSDGRSVAWGFYNPHSLIAVRTLGRSPETVDRDFFVRRIRRALDLRSRLYPGSSSFRLVHGESDDLPGLLIDKLEDCLVMQVLCLGMDQRKEEICGALQELLAPRCLIERNDSHLREREGLPQGKGILHGEDPGLITIEEDGVRFQIDPLGGHKTGFYFDQRENRIFMRRFAREARVLDVFCNEGGFALQSARGGAAGVIGIDISGDCVERARGNARLNGLEGITRFEEADAVPAMDWLKSHGAPFDVVILDPPSFTRTKKNVLAAKKGYEEVNVRAIRLLKRDGILATASCSFHITDETFLGVVRGAATRLGRPLRLLEWRSQAPDHPILPAMPETRYLKFGVFQVG